MNGCETEEKGGKENASSSSSDDGHAADGRANEKHDKGEKKVIHGCTSSSGGKGHTDEDVTIAQAKDSSGIRTSAWNSAGTLINTL